jgi:hypothetical protein
MTTGFRSAGKGPGFPGGPLSVLVLMTLCVAGTGCGDRPEGPPLTAEPEATTPDQPPAVTTPEAGPAAPFEPPALADLDRGVTWIDRPVRDALVVLREQQAAEEPLCTAAEALAGCPTPIRPTAGPASTATWPGTWAAPIRS